MKKLILALLLLSTNAYADTIALGTVSADATATGFNSNFQGIANVLNGNVEGSCDGGVSACNMKADSIYRINMADDADPATFAKETLQITVDTTSSEGSFTASGCTPADDTDLTSDISACISYVNGIRVSKSATANTYTASRDCYVDLSQTGVYTTSCVTNGAAEPSVAANSARLAKVVTDGTEITTITDLANRAVPGLLVPTNFRSGLVVSMDSTTTMTVSPGTIEVNETMIAKTTATTLTISTAGDWAGGSSLRATNTYGFVGIDASGNVDMHTTAPTHSNYAVSSTAGRKRYATWSSTVYRIIGWFRMNGTGSGELDNFGVSNLPDMGTTNKVVRKTGTDENISASQTTFQTVDGTDINFYSFGGTVEATGQIAMRGTASEVGYVRCNFDAISQDSSVVANGFVNSDDEAHGFYSICESRDDGSHDIFFESRVRTATNYRIDNSVTVVEESDN